jgi:hypothetical protein
MGNFTFGVHEVIKSQHDRHFTATRLLSHRFAGRGEGRGVRRAAADLQSRR